MENKQTAVEWLEEQINLTFYVAEASEMNKRFQIVFQQAKQMEKDQIINARINGDENHTFNSMVREDYANDYYNETYGK
jgi:hypothetical protein